MPHPGKQGHERPNSLAYEVRGHNSRKKLLSVQMKYKSTNISYCIEICYHEMDPSSIYDRWNTYGWSLWASSCQLEEFEILQEYQPLFPALFSSKYWLRVCCYLFSLYVLAQVQANKKIAHSFKRKILVEKSPPICSISKKYDCVGNRAVRITAKPCWSLWPPTETTYLRHHHPL